MTVPATTSAVTYAGTGSTSVFPFTWQVNSAADLVVYTWVPATGVITQLALNTGFTLTGVGSTSGGSVTLVTGNLPTGTSLFIASDPALVQPLTLNNAAAFNASDIMNQLDYLTREVQGARRVANNSLQFPVVESLAGLSSTVPVASLRALKQVGFDASGNVIATTTLSNTAASAALIPVITAASLGAGRTALGNVPGSQATIAALRAVAVTDLAGVQVVQGYYAAGDGGGSSFIWNASDVRADNGGTVIQVTGVVTGRWNMLVTSPMNVRQFGAKGDTTTDDSAAFTAALAASGIVYVPPGTYNVHNIQIPTQQQLIGAGEDQSILRPTSGGGAGTFCLQMASACWIKDLQVNANNTTERGISINGDFCNILNTKVQYAYYGIYNVAHDVWNIVGCHSSNNQYGIYSAERGITCVIDRHYSSNDVYFFYSTYVTQQPQFITLSNSSIDTGTWGVYCNLDIYWLIVENTSFNAISNTAIYLGTPAAGAGSSVYIKHNYMSATSQGISIGPGYTGVEILGNQINDSTGGLIAILATSTVQSLSVNIKDNAFGRCGAQSIYLDSVDGCTVEGNLFTPTLGAPYNATSDIIFAQSFTGFTQKAVVRRNRFRKAVPLSVGYSDSYENIGWTTKATGTGTVANAATTATVTHGMSATPTRVLVTPLAGNLGSIWITAIGGTTFQVNCSTAAGAGNGLFAWQAFAD